MTNKTIILESNHLICPFCNTKLKAVDPISKKDDNDDNEPPREGDFTLCGECGEILIFCDNDNDMFLKQATSKDFDEMLLDSPETYNQMLEISKFIKEKNVPSRLL